MSFNIRYKNIVAVALAILGFLPLLVAQQNNTEYLFAQLTTDLEDTSKVNMLNKLSSVAYKNALFDTAIYYAQRALELATSKQYRYGIAKANNNIGVVHLVKSDYRNALACFTTSLKIMEELSDTKGQANLYSNMGIIYYRQGLAPLALSYFFKALKIDLANKDSTNMSQDYRDIGMVYKYQENFHQALEYYKQALEIQKASQDSVNLSITYNNIGAMYASQNQNKEALNNYEKALNIMEQIKGASPHALSFYHQNIGVLYKEMGEYEQAYKHLLIARKGYEHADDKQSVGTNYMHIGNLFLLQQKTLLGKAELLKALAISEKFNNHESLSEIYHSLAFADSTLGYYKSAFGYFQKYSAYKDSVFNESNNKEITTLQLNYEFTQREDSLIMNNQKILAIKEATLSGQRQKQWLMGAGIGLLMVVGGLLFYQNRAQKKNNSKLSQLNQALDEKALQNQVLVKEMHHRIKNNLYMVYSLLDIQSHNTNNEETQQQLQVARQRIESIASTHEQLFQIKQGKVFMKQYIEQFINRSIEQITQRKKIVSHIDIETTITLNLATCMPLAMLINEWLTNSVKYAEDAIEEIHIYLSCELDEVGEAILDYYDNGVLNFDKSPIHDPSASSGIGKRIIQLLSRQMQAQLTTNYKDKPFHYHLSFPI